MTNQFTQHTQETSRLVLGAFYPHSYSIGLTWSDVEERFQSYPLKIPNDPTELARFFRNLVFCHEFVHFSQFICTSFGLQMARTTNICQNILLHHGPWEMPILHDYAKKLNGEQLNRIISYLYLANSMNVRRKTYPPGVLPMVTDVALASIPTSPALGLFGGEYPGFLQSIDFIRQVNAPIRGSPQLLVGRPHGEIENIALTTGVLFEGFAHLTEVNHIGNAFSLGGEDLLNAAMRYPLEYLGTFVTYIHIFDLPYNYFVIQLAELIDIALMYSPHILHNIGPAHEVDKGGDKYKHPPEIFIDACIAAQTVAPVRSPDYEEAQRFQDDVCAAMGVPTTSEMTDHCLARLKQIGIADQATCLLWLKDKTPISSSRMFALHWLGLMFRKENGPGFFLRMIKVDYIIELLERTRGACTFFDLRNKKPIEVLHHQLSQSCIHHLMWDAFYKSHLSCPLKEGKPYYCPLADGDPDKLCVFITEGSKDTLGECPLDIFERLLQSPE